MIIYLKQGQLSKAQDWVREHGFSEDDDLSYLREFEHITRARVLLAEYQVNRKVRIIQDALSLLKRLLKAAEDQKRMGSILEILIVTALAYHAHGSTSKAFASLERALTLARPEGYFRILVGEGIPIGQPLEGHIDNVFSLAFNPEGKTLASGSADRIIILWDINPQSWIKATCQRVGRNFTPVEWAQYFPDQEYRPTCS